VLGVAENVEQPRRYTGPQRQRSRQRHSHGEGHVAVACERRGNLLAPFLRGSLDGEAVLQVEMFGLEDRQVACWQVGGKLGRVRQHEHPPGIVQLTPSGRGNSQKPRQVLNRLAVCDFNGGQQEIRQKLALLPDHIHAKVC
jgi:hypothetical protein